MWERACSLPQVLHSTHVIGGCLGQSDRRDRSGHLVHRDCVRHHGNHCSNYHGYGHPSRPGHCRPNRAPGAPGNRFVAKAGNNAVPVDTPAAGGSTAALAGNSGPAVSNTGAARCSNRHWSSNPRYLSSTARGTCKPRNCSSCLLHRHRARTRQVTILIQPSEELGGAVFDRAWRPPGPRVSHTSDAGERQSIIR